jgi:signal transduction histidine kinase
MTRNSSIRYGERATYLKRLHDFHHSLAFRLTAWYAGIFTVSLLGAFVAFYMLPLHGSHGISRHALSELREDFLHYFGTPLLVILVLSAGVGWFMARRALSGVDEVTRAAIDISKGALDRRVPVRGSHDEIDRLADTFNTMVNRVQDLISQMKEISENIAHDLRSPITRMRGIAEMALAREDPDEERTTMAGAIIEECDRLLGMINAMLDISEAESGLARLDMRNVDLVEMLRDVCDLFQPLAEDRNVDVTIDAPKSARMACDLRKVQRVFSNLLDNALKYTPPGGGIRILAEERVNETVVTIRDTGIGIPEGDLPHIFDRFFRGEESRSTPGNGLGLSLAQAFVTIHGGNIAATSTLGRGSQFVVTLPRIFPITVPQAGSKITKR